MNLGRTPVLCALVVSPPETLAEPLQENGVAQVTYLDRCCVTPSHQNVIRLDIAMQDGLPVHAEQALDHTLEAVFAESFRIAAVRLLDYVSELTILHEFQDHV